MRIVLMGLGPVGLSLARLVTARPGLDLVGALDPSPALAGRDLGALLGRSPLGLPVDSDVAAVIARARPEVVLHATGSFLADIAEQLRSIVCTGVSAVSTCEELAYPFYRHPTLARELDSLAAANGAVLLGAGVNPGFVMDKLVITLMGAARSVRGVLVRRVVDAATRRGPLQRKIGAGLTLAQFEQRAQTGRFGHIGLAESAHMIADALGTPPERTLREELKPVIATRALTTAHLRVEPGAVAGIDQCVRLEAEGDERVRLEIQMSVGAEHPMDRIVLDAVPPMDLSIANGLHGDEATAAVVVNCAYLLRSLTPGLRTMLDVPVRGFELRAPSR